MFNNKKNKNKLLLKVENMIFLKFFSFVFGGEFYKINIIDDLSSFFHLSIRFSRLNHNFRFHFYAMAMNNFVHKKINSSGNGTFYPCFSYN